MVGSNEHAQLREALEFCLEKDLERILLSNPSDPDHFSREYEKISVNKILL